MGVRVAKWVRIPSQISQGFRKAFWVCEMSLHRLFKFRMGIRKVNNFGIFARLRNFHNGLWDFHRVYKLCSVFHVFPPLEKF